MPSDINATCKCGQLHLRLSDATPKNGNHGLCYCTDCQAFARHLGQLGTATDDQGGTEIFQTQPARVEIVSGQDQLAVLQLAPKGLYRWYARCCNTAICNTMGKPTISFVGILVANMDTSPEALGPINFRYKREQALSEVVAPSGSMARFVMRTVGTIVKERLSGRWKQTPFFDIETGRSVVKPRVLTDEERDKAYAR